MAERLLRRRFRQHGLDGMTVRSAGFIDREGRHSPETAVAVAEEYGVDLSNHRSTCVSSELTTESDLILLMDVYNYTLLRRNFSASTEKACFLGSFSSDTGSEISDPYDGSIAEFQRVYGEIATAVDQFVDELADDRN